MDFSQILFQTALEINLFIKKKNYLAWSLKALIRKFARFWSQAFWTVC